MRRTGCLLIVTWFLSGVLGGGVAIVQAQTTDPKVPASSPLWWTLTDGLAPQQLRRIYADPEDSRRRYALAVERKLVQPLPQEKLDKLLFFQNGALSPELLPMWEAFDAFALRLRHRPSWDEEKAAADLQKFDVSAAGAEVVARESSRYLTEVDALIEKIRDDQQAFVEIMRQAKRTLGKEGLDRALKSRDVPALALAAGRRVPETGRLMEQWEIDPTASVAESMLPELKRELSPRDWELFRGYLLKEVSPLSSAIEFKD